MIIAIPSKDRAATAKTPLLLPQATLFVPESQAAAYGERFPNSLVPVPDSIRGITATRNFILDYAKTGYVVQMDDDIFRIGYIEMSAEKGKVHPISAETFENELIRLSEIAQELGYSIFGVKTESALRSYYPYKPLLFHSYVLGTCMGVNAATLRFDESYKVKEDYELCLRCLRDEGGVLAARYLFAVAEHWVGEGGCKTYRTQVVEEEAIQKLLRAYPGMIRRVRRKDTHYCIELDF